MTQPKMKIAPFLMLALLAAASSASAGAPISQPPEEAARAAGGIHVLAKDAGRIKSLLSSSGWVSPGLKGRPLYMLSFRSCPDCIRFETEEFPGLHKAGVDTRVIMVARRAKSTAPERTGVGELWAARSWKTYETWTSMPVDAWTGEGLASGDDDPKRAALVEKGRVLVEELRPLLLENGVELRYPTLVWTTADGVLKACACEERETYRYIRSELGVPGE
jgi:hypothetical protein